MKDRVGEDNKEERLGLFGEGKIGREESSKKMEKNTETKINEGNSKLFIERQEHTKSSRGKVNKSTYFCRVITQESCPG